MKKRQIQLIYVLMCVWLTVGMTQAVQKYEVTDLGQDYTPLSFNENGQVVMIQSEYGQEPPDQLYLWDKGQTTQIYPTNEWFGDVRINNSGTIVGFIQKPYEGTQNSFKKEGGSLEITPSVLFWDINNAGQIVQVSSHPATGESQTHLINSDGSLLDCDNAGNIFTVGVAVNNVGQVTGATGNDHNNFYGFVWDAASGKHYLSPLDGDMGALGFDINNHGQIVGYSATSMEQSPEEWDWNLVIWNADGVITDLGCKLSPWGIPVSLNDFGQIVGDFKLPGDSDFDSYFWEEESGFIAVQELLEDGSLWTIDGLYAINNLGQIIGTAGGHGILLTPVPEPGTIGLILLGMVCLRRKSSH